MPGFFRFPDEALFRPREPVFASALANAPTSVLFVDVPDSAAHVHHFVRRTPTIGNRSMTYGGTSRGFCQSLYN